MAKEINGKGEQNTGILVLSRSTAANLNKHLEFLDLWLWLANSQSQVKWKPAVSMEGTETGKRRRSEEVPEQDTSYDRKTNTLPSQKMAKSVSVRFSSKAGIFVVLLWSFPSIEHFALKRSWHFQQLSKAPPLNHLSSLEKKKVKTQTHRERKTHSPQFTRVRFCALAEYFLRTAPFFPGLHHVMNRRPKIPDSSSVEVIIAEW